MTAKFFAILTNQGAAALANATALGTRVDLTHIAVGDGGGVLPTPDPAQTALKGEKRRAAINMLTIDPGNDSQIIAEQIIPENEGGWWIREIGLLSADGTLIAVANCPETYKPQLQEGSGRTQTIRMVLIVSSTEVVTLKIDPSVVLATRQYVDEQIGQHEKSRNHPDATLTEKGFVQLNSATDSNSEARAATPKAVKAANDNANTRLLTTNNLSEIRVAGRNAQLAAQENIGLAEYGISPAVKATAGTDLNTVLTRGDSVVTAPLNGPMSGDTGTIFLQVRTWQSGTGVTGYRTVQEASGYGQSGSTGGRVWRRTWTGSVWSNWIEFYSESRKPTADDIGALSRKDFPVGIPQPWPLSTAPTGWLKCNGAAFDKVQYPLLAQTYSNGRLPDLRGEFIRGWDDGRNVDGGRQLLSGQVGTIVGGKDDNTDGGDISYLADGSSVNYGSDAVTAADYPGIVARYASTGAQVNPATPTFNFFSVTRPRNIAFNYIVRAA
ncbi:phage tail protein [Serratia quinivorans]|uniref:phage tail-collar fiber domain-containing protein n=1 Tax=Serratia quinivorans TaxID=137545 RepID=UPI002E76BC4D|nr:phage tail protein [Serratia quinivorans]